MTSHCVFKFQDESVGRIAPTKLVKLQDNKIFCPASARDLPEDLVKVKWQKSLSDGSFSSDGYFKAEVLAIAGSVKTALAKAAELKIRMHSSPVLELPQASNSPSPKKKQRKCKKTSKDENTREVKKGSEDRPKAKKRPSNKSTEVVSDSDGCTKAKKKKLQLADNAIQRCSSQGELAVLTNPLLAGLSTSGESKDSDNADEKTLADHKTNSIVTESAENSSGVMNCQNDSGDSSDHQKTLSCPKGNLILAESAQKTSGSEDDPMNGNDGNKSKANSSDSEMDSESDESSEKKPLSPVCEDDNLDETQPVVYSDDSIDSIGLDSEIKYFDEKKTSSSSSSSSSDSEDEVAKLSAAKGSLQKQVLSLKEDLVKSKRDLNLANNCRVAHKNKIVELEKEIKSLEKKNSALQDMICQSVSGKKDKREKVMSPKPHSAVKRLEFDDSNAKAKLEEKESSPKKGFGCISENAHDKTFGDNSFDYNIFDSTPAKKKKKKKNQDARESISVINEVSGKVLNHLKGTTPLKPDEKGFVKLGNNVLIDLQAMEDTLKESRNDIQKISKGLAGLVWTASQREERSLEGGKNNRYPNAPAKKAATPAKVNTCLGVVKAYLLHQGERDGPGLSENLKTGRKAIGSRFSQDYSQSKRRAS